MNIPGDRSGGHEIYPEAPSGVGGASGIIDGDTYKINVLLANAENYKKKLLTLVFL